MPAVDAKALQAQLIKWGRVVNERVQAVEKVVGKSSLAPEEGFDLWDQLRADALGAADQLVQMATQQRGQGPSCYTCTNGVCCNSRIDVVLLDAVPILRAKDEAGELTPAFLERCRDRNREEKMAGRPQAWMAKRIPCLFLRSGRCSVYAQRPIPCAQFFVWSDPVYCLDMDPAGVMPLVSPVQKMLHVALGGLIDRLIGTHDPGFTGTTLPGALWVMGTAWPLRKDPRAFRREVERLVRKVTLSRNRNS